MDKTELSTRFTDTMAKFTAYFGKHLPDDVLAKLKEMRTKQDTPLAKVMYDSMFTDLELADKFNVPFCQDTGVIQYWIECGSEFPLIGQMQECLREATIRATKEAPLRHNAVQIFDEKNTGNNTGVRIPWIDWEIIPGSDQCTIHGYMAGGGCSLPGTAKVLMPVEGYEGVVRFVFDNICDRGINACPPLLVGIGIASGCQPLQESADASDRLTQQQSARCGIRTDHRKGSQRHQHWPGRAQRCALRDGGSRRAGCASPLVPCRRPVGRLLGPSPRNHSI